MHMPDLLIPQTATIMTEPVAIDILSSSNFNNIPTTPKSDIDRTECSSVQPQDKYEEIYARYLSVLDGHPISIAAKQDGDDIDGGSGFAVKTESTSCETKEEPPQQQEVETDHDIDPFESLMTTATLTANAGSTTTATTGGRDNSNNLKSTNPIDPPEEFVTPIKASKYKHTPRWGTMTSMTAHRCDPVEEYATTSTATAGTTVNVGYAYPRQQQSYTPMGFHQQHQAQDTMYDVIPPTVASRDDDVTILSSSQYSVRGNIDHGSGGESSSSTQLLQREDLYSKIDLLNAKSRALRGIRSPPPTSSTLAAAVPPSSGASVLSAISTTLAPSVSVLSSPSYYNTPSNSTLNVDARLEMLTKQSMALRNNIRSSATTGAVETAFASNNKATAGGGGDANNTASSDKKVTFETNVGKIYETMSSAGGGVGGGSVHGSKHSNEAVAALIASSNSLISSGALSSTAAATTAAAADTVSLPIPTASNSSVTGTSTTTTMTKSTKSHSPHSLAMKILSEKILDGYTMTRNHCPNCNMVLLTKKNAHPSMSRNTMDGKLSIWPSQETCFICPVEVIRKSITRGVCKRVMAAKLLSGLEVGRSGSNGRSLCDGCHSPGLVNSGGTIMECQVCPVLDKVCVEIVREQGRGGIVQELRSCIECGSPELYTVGCGMKCVACDVLKKNMGDDYHYRRGFPKSSLSPPAAADARSVASESQYQSFASIGVGSGASVASGLVVGRNNGGGAAPVMWSPSQPPGLSTSVSLKSNASRRYDLAKLQTQIQAELSKAKISVKALESKMPVQQESDSVMSPQLIKSPSITSGESPPVDLNKIEEQLKVVLDKAEEKSRSSSPDNGGSPKPINLSTLQEQLKIELKKARESQAALERSLSGVSNNHSLSSRKKSRDELREELNKAKEAQLALERIIEGTNNITDDELEEGDSSRGGNTDELLAAQPDDSRMNQSYSISQQEVDASGNLKEYIPTPSYFFNSNIPTEVIVYHAAEAPDDPSVAISHHAKNLKRSENEFYASKSSGFMGCCGEGESNVQGRANYRQRMNYHDDDTIETDDYTVDYTLNTMDSRLEYLQKSHSKHDRYDIVDDARESRHERDVAEAIGQCFAVFFGCGVGDGEDAYSMVSSRGIEVKQQQQQQLQHGNSQHHGRTEMPYGVRYERESSYHRQDSDHYSSPNQSVDESEFGSICRTGEHGDIVPSHQGMRNDGRDGPRHDGYGMDDSDFVESPQPRNRASNNNRAEHDSVDESDFGSMCRIDGGDNMRINDGCVRPKQQKQVPMPEWGKSEPQRPKSSLRPPRPPTHPTRAQPYASPRGVSDYSIQSDLTEDYHSVNNKRVTFSSQKKSRKPSERYRDDRYSVDKDVLLSVAEGAARYEHGRSRRQ